MAVDRDAHRDEPGRAAFPPPAPGTTEAPAEQRVVVAARVRWLIRAIRDSDDAAVEEAVLRLSRSRRLFAPLALAVGAVVTLFEGLKLLFANWRLTLIQVLPAMWIWAAMYDLKAHVFYGKTYHVVQGPARIPIVLAITAITMASFFLNAVFAFAIAQPGLPLIRPAFREARSHRAAHARLPRAAHPRHRRVPGRPDLAGGHHKRGQGGQAGRQAHHRPRAGGRRLVASPFCASRGTRLTRAGSASWRTACGWRTPRRLREWRWPAGRAQWRSRHGWWPPPGGATTNITCEPDCFL